MDFTESSSNKKELCANDTNLVDLNQLKLKSDQWSLEDDIKLLETLESLGNNLIFKSQKIYNKLDSLDYESQVKLIKTNNMINEFQMLANSQFFENRTYDEEAENISFNNSQILSKKEGQNEKSISNENLFKTIKDALSSSFKFIDDNFKISEKNNFESDDDEDYITDILSKAISNNSFNRNPLPYIIGSNEFLSDMVFNQTDDIFEVNKLDSKANVDKEEYNSNHSENDFSDEFENTFSHLQTKKNSENLDKNNDAYHPLSSSDIGSINKKLNLGHQNDYDFDKKSDNDELFKSFIQKIENISESSNSTKNQIKAQIQAHIQAELTKKLTSLSLENEYNSCDNLEIKDDFDKKDDDDLFSPLKSSKNEQTKKLFLLENDPNMHPSDESLSFETETTKTATNLFPNPESEPVVEKKVSKSLSTSNFFDSDNVLKSQVQAQIRAELAKKLIFSSSENVFKPCDNIVEIEKKFDDEEINEEDDEDLFLTFKRSSNKQITKSSSIKNNQPTDFVSQTLFFEAEETKTTTNLFPNPESECVVEKKINKSPLLFSQTLNSDSDSDDLFKSLGTISKTKATFDSNSFADKNKIKPSVEKSNIESLFKQTQNLLESENNNENYNNANNENQNIIDIKEEKDNEKLFSIEKTIQFNDSTSFISKPFFNSQKSKLQNNLSQTKFSSQLNSSLFNSFESSSSTDEEKVINSDKSEINLPSKLTFSSESDSDDLFKDLPKTKKVLPKVSPIKKKIISEETDKTESEVKINHKNSQKFNSLFFSVKNDEDDNLFSLCKKPLLETVSSTCKSPQLKISNISSSSDSEISESKEKIIKKNRKKADKKSLINNSKQIKNNLNALFSDSEEDLFCALKTNSKQKQEMHSHANFQNKLNFIDSSKLLPTDQNLYSRTEKKLIEPTFGFSPVLDESNKINQSLLTVSQSKQEFHYDEEINQNYSKNSLFDHLNSFSSKSCTILNNDYLKDKLKVGIARNKRNPTRRVQNS